MPSPADVTESSNDFQRSDQENMGSEKGKK